MNKKIIEVTKKELEKATHEFESAKAEAINALKNMSINTAVEFGACLACRIDNVNRYAAEVKKCTEFLRMIEFYQKNNMEDSSWK